MRRAPFETKWVVYAKTPFGGAEQVFSYLGRYTHRVGISNVQLQIEVEPATVSLDERDGSRLSVWVPARPCEAAHTRQTWAWPFGMSANSRGRIYDYRIREQVVRTQPRPVPAP